MRLCRRACAERLCLSDSFSFYLQQGYALPLARRSLSIKYRRETESQRLSAQTCGTAADVALTFLLTSELPESALAVD